MAHGTNTHIRKFLVWMVASGMLVSLCFGSGWLPVAHAQAAGTTNGSSLLRANYRVG